MLLVSALLIGCGSAAASGVGYDEAKGLIGILTNGEIAFEQQETAVTRRAFIEKAVKLFGADEPSAESVGFSDVAADDEFYGVLCRAVGMGIVSDAELFRPDDEISFTEAAKILCTVMGYKNRAEALGGYPNGYIRTANEAHLFDGTGKIFNSDAEAMLLYNALVNNAAEEASYKIKKSGSFSMGYRAGGENLLGRLYDIYIAEGRVNANEYSVLGSGSAENRDGRYELDGASYELEYKDGNSFLGFRVRAYYREQSEIGKIVYVSPVKNTVVKINAWDCEYNKAEKSVYVISEKKTYRLNKGFDYIYNGKAFYGYGDDIVPNNGVLELIDCDSDSEFDTVAAQDIYYLTVSASNAVYKTISDTLDSGKSLDLSGSKCRYSIYDAEGGSLSVGDVTAEMVFAVAASEDKSLVNMYLCEESVSGVYEAFDKEERLIKVGEDEYRLDTDFEKRYIGSLRLGETYTFGLGLSGEIISFSESKGRYHYGYVIKAAIEGRLKKTLSIKLFTEDSKFEILECSEKARLNAAESSAEEIKAALTDGSGETDSQLIRYRLDGDGKIINIDTAETGTEINLSQSGNPDDSLESFSGGAPWYFRHNVFYPNFNINGATVFCVPSNRKYAEEESYYKIGHSFADGTYESTKVIPYNIGPNGSAEIVVYKTNDATSVSADNNQGKIMMVEKVVMGADEDGSWLRKIIGWQNGMFVEMLIDDDVEIHKSNGVRELEGGDVIRYAAADNKITALSVDFIGATLSRNTDEDNAEVPKFNVRSNPNHYQAGNAYVVSDGYIYLYDDDFSFGSMINAALPSKIALYDFNTKKIRTVDSNYLRTYTANGAGSGFMLIKQHYQNSEAGFFYINK